MDVAVRVFVADEALFLAVEAQDAAGLHRRLGEVHEGAGAMAVELVEREFFSCLHRFNEIGHLRFRVFELRELLFEVGGMSDLKPFIILPFGPWMYAASA